MESKKPVRRLREALREAYDLGFEHGKPKAGFTGAHLAKITIGRSSGWRIGDERHLRKAYSAGIWDREITEKENANDN